MARIFAQNCSELAIKATYGGKPVVNVLHFVNDEGSTSDSAKARDFLNNWQDHVMAHLDNGYALQEAVYRSIDPDDTNQAVLLPDNTKRIVGAATGIGFPPNVAYLVKKGTANRQRGQRNGRIFLAGVPNAAATESGVIQPGYVSTINAALAQFLNGVNDGGFATNVDSGMVVLNTTPESRVPGTQPVMLTWRRVNALTLDPVLSTQRDRLR